MTITKVSRQGLGDLQVQVLLLVTPGILPERGGPLPFFPGGGALPAPGRPA